MKWMWIPVIIVGIIFLSAIGAVVGMIAGMIAVPVMVVIWFNGSLTLGNDAQANNNQDRI